MRIKSSAIVPAAVLAAAVCAATALTVAGCGGGSESTQSPGPTPTPHPTPTPVGSSSPTPTPSRSPQPTPTPMPSASVGVTLTDATYGVTKQITAATIVGETGNYIVPTGQPTYTHDSDGSYWFQGYVQQGGKGNGYLSGDGVGIAVEIESSAPLVEGKTYRDSSAGGPEDEHVRITFTYGEPNESTGYTYGYIGRQATITRFTDAEIGLDLGGPYNREPVFDGDVPTGIVTGDLTFIRYAQYPPK